MDRSPFLSIPYSFGPCKDPYTLPFVDIPAQVSHQPTHPRSALGRKQIHRRGCAHSPGREFWNSKYAESMVQKGGTAGRAHALGPKDFVPCQIRVGAHTVWSSAGHAALQGHCGITKRCPHPGQLPIVGQTELLCI